MKTLFISFFILLSAFSFGQESDRWTYVGKSSSGMKIYVTDIIKEPLTSSNVYDCWIKIADPPKTFKNKRGITITKNSTYTKEHWKLYCDTKSYKVLYYADYNSNGTPAKSDSPFDEFNEFIPETLGEAVYQYVCVIP